MTSSATEAALGADWLSICRRAEEGAAGALRAFSGREERSRASGMGEGGDVALAIDRAAEDAILAELEGTGLPLTVICEESGHLELAGGGPVHVVVDPIDGSRNAKRGIPAWCVSIAVAAGPLVGDVRCAYVRDGASGEEWWARSGEGAFLDGERLAELDPDGPLELVGLEFIHPHLVAEAASGLQGAGVARLRAVGSIALTLCWVGGGRLDGMVSLAGCRSVDIAAGQLILREVGGVLAFVDEQAPLESAPLELAWRSRVFAAAGEAGLAQLCTMR